MLVCAAESPSLRSADSFVNIADPAQRSAALFTEATRVFLHPRCVNCHPAGDSPTQLDNRQLHEPPVERGPENHGVVGMQCGACHQDHNLPEARVPGAPKWALAPKIMQWSDRTPQSLCEQLKDPARNGGRTLAQIVDHVSHDALVGWAWAPGADRVPAPGTQAQFGALIAAWVRSGAVCPAATAKKESR